MNFMKQVVYKAVFLIAATFLVSFFTRTASNACDKTLLSPNCQTHKQLPETTRAASTETTEHLDFIVTNSVLRF